MVKAATAKWHAERQARRPKVAKLATNDRLRDYVQQRLADEIRRPDGAAVPGPDVAWIGRGPDAGRIVGGHTRGVPSRSPTG